MLNGLSQQLRQLRLSPFPRGFVRAAVFQDGALQAGAGQLLAEAVMQFVANAAPLVFADRDDLLLQAVAFSHLFFECEVAFGEIVREFFHPSK